MFGFTFVIRLVVFLQAFEKFSVEKDVAEHIKKMFDQKYGPTWHCIVGKNFGNHSSFLCFFFFVLFSLLEWLRIGDLRFDVSFYFI